MSYTTSLLERDADDTNGQRLADSLAHHLTYWWSNGLEDFIAVPIVNDGRTIGVIVGAMGENPSLLGGFDAFKELTGLTTVEDAAAFLGVPPDKLQSSVNQHAN